MAFALLSVTLRIANKHFLDDKARKINKQIADKLISGASVAKFFCLLFADVF